MAKRISNLSSETRESIRSAVSLAVEYWPNAHLGDISPREDMRSAFKIIRAYVDLGHHVSDGAYAVRQDAYNCMDM